MVPTVVPTTTTVTPGKGSPFEASVTLPLIVFCWAYPAMVNSRNDTIQNNFRFFRIIIICTLI